MSDRATFGVIVFLLLMVGLAAATLPVGQPAPPPAYEVIEASTREELNSAVSTRLGAGWRPQGGVSAVCTSSFCTYYQAVTRP